MFVKFDEFYQNFVFFNFLSGVLRQALRTMEQVFYRTGSVFRGVRIRTLTRKVFESAQVPKAMNHHVHHLKPIFDSWQCSCAFV